MCTVRVQLLDVQIFVQVIVITLIAIRELVDVEDGGGEGARAPPHHQKTGKIFYGQNSCNIWALC